MLKIEPSLARTYIKRGWNIENRKLLKQSVGESEYSNLLNTFGRIYERGNAIPSLIGGMGKLYFKSGIPKLKQTNGNLTLFLNVGIEDIKKNMKTPLKFLNTDINISNIDHVLKNFECGARKSYSIKFPESEFMSETMKKLYSPDFAPKRRRTKDGIAVTTIIDNKTQKPVEAYVKCIRKDDGFEIWKMFINKDGKYSEIGSRTFDIDKNTKSISCGYMKSTGNSEFSGIGLRLHQIAVERMMQNGFNKIEIETTPKSFMFNHKAGFRFPQVDLPFRKDSLDEYIKYWSKNTGIAHDEARKNLISKTKNGKTYISNETTENFIAKAVQKGNTQCVTEMDIYKMNLRDKWLETWKDMAQLQPILL